MHVFHGSCGVLIVSVSWICALRFIYFLNNNAIANHGTSELSQGSPCSRQRQEDIIFLARKIQEMQREGRLESGSGVSLVLE